MLVVAVNSKQKVKGGRLLKVLLVVGTLSKYSRVRITSATFILSVIIVSSISIVLHTWRASRNSTPTVLGHIVWDTWMIMD